MALNKILAIGLVLISTAAFSETNYDEKYYTIAKVELSEISHDVILDQEIQKSVSDAYLDQGVVGGLATAGQVIGVLRDLVALGEGVYGLVSKGKPNVTTNTAPISVLPRVGGSAVDILDTDGWSMPSKRTYQMTLKNLYNVTVVTFRYSIIFSYNGSYNGKGKYITGAQIVPDYVNVLWGFDFNATMKLAGMQNQGSRENPIAGATLRLEYSTSNILNSRSTGYTFYINGAGGFKRL